MILRLWIDSIDTKLLLQIIANGMIGNLGHLIVQKCVMPMLLAFGSALELSYGKKRVTAHALDNPVITSFASATIHA